VGSAGASPTPGFPLRLGSPAAVTEVGSEVELGGADATPPETPLPAAGSLSSSGGLLPSCASGFARASIAPDARWGQREV
jgi:hypothetical protein